MWQQFQFPVFPFCLCSFLFITSPPTHSMQRNISVFHSIQTNGICLDEEWASFFKTNSFLVGISLDGTQENHDLYRLDATGKGTWDKVTRTIALLDAYGVETNLLCVVTGQLARKPQRAFKSLCELGRHDLQFIPCLDPLDTIGGQAYSLTPELYGRFLCGVFDAWYNQLQRGNYVSVRNFEDYLRILLGMPPTSCASSGSCGHYLTVEGDGSLYPCDFYVLDEWKLGDLSYCTVEDALDSPVSRMFLEQGRKRPAECAACVYRPLCQGGCKRDWDTAGSNRFCTAYKQFFSYALPRLQTAARFLTQQNR